MSFTSFQLCNTRFSYHKIFWQYFFVSFQAAKTRYCRLGDLQLLNLISTLRLLKSSSKQARERRKKKCGRKKELLTPADILCCELTSNKSKMSGGRKRDDCRPNICANRLSYTVKLQMDWLINHAAQWRKFSTTRQNNGLCGVRF